MHKWGGSSAFPPVMTVFSAPNYCGTYNNKGAVIVLENDNKLTIKQYRNVEHPYHLPKKMDLFSFSIPYLAEQVSNMLLQFVAKNSPMTPLTSKEQEDFSKMKENAMMDDKLKAKIEKREHLRRKILAVEIGRAHV